MDQTDANNKLAYPATASKAQAKAPPIEEATKFGQWVAQVRKTGLADYAKGNLPAFRMEPAKGGASQFGIERILSWAEKNPKLLGEFEKDWAKGNLVTIPWGKLSQSENPQKFDSALTMWIGIRYAFSEYTKKGMQGIPERADVKWGAEFEKNPGLAICAQKSGGELGPAAAISLNPGKGAQNASLAGIAYPLLKGGQENKAGLGVPGEPTQRELQDTMKKGAFDTEFFSQYLMRMNSITSPEVKAKISGIFLRLGALIKDNPALAFSDFVGEFVVEANQEFGKDLATFRKMPVRADRGGMRKAGVFVPKKISGGGGPGKPPSA